MPPPPMRRTISYRLLRTFPPLSAFGLLLRAGLASSPGREVAPISALSATSPVETGIEFSSTGTSVLPPTPRLLDRSGSTGVPSGSSTFKRAPQPPQKFSSGATSAPHSLQAGITYPVQVRGPSVVRSSKRRRLLAETEPQKSLTDNYFVPFVQRLTLAGFQPGPAIDEGTIRRPEIFNFVVPVLNGNSCVLSRDLRFRIV